MRAVHACGAGAHQALQLLSKIADEAVLLLLAYCRVAELYCVDRAAAIKVVGVVCTRSATRSLKDWLDAAV